MAKGPSKFLFRLFNKNTQLGQGITSQTETNTLLNYYASLARYHPDLIIVLSSNRQIISQNHGSINEFLGYPSSKKLDFESLISKKQYIRLQAAFNKASKGTPERMEISIEHQKGYNLYARLTFIPIKKGATDTEGVFLIVRDITEHKRLTNALETKERHLTQAQQIANIGSWEYVIEEDKLFCSESFYDIFGMDKSVKEPRLDNVLNYIHPDDYHRVQQALQHAIQTGELHSLDFRILKGNSKQVRFIKAEARVAHNNNEPPKLVGVIKDYTNQKQIELQEQKSQEQLRHIFDNLEVGIWIKEYGSWNTSYISMGAANILQIPLDSILDDKMWESMIHPEHLEEVLEKRKLLIHGDTVIHTYRVNCGDGTTKWLYDQTVPWFDENENLTHLFGMFADITSEMEMQKKLEYFATHDPLTNLPNQRSLYEKIDTLCNKADAFAVLYLDLDRFVLINDSLGHHIGDLVLKKIATKLHALLPRNGYIARINNDEFIITIENHPSKTFIMELAEKVINTFEEPILVEDFELYITTSIGIGFFPDDGNNKVELIANAHAALYHAEKLGKNNYQFYSDTKDISSYKKFILERDMRKAIEKGEFELYYQPQVKADNGIIQGAEALIRWNHEDWGLVSPGEFIPLAEENHLINKIGDWVLKKVCSQLREWKDAGYTLRPISINISPIRFMKKGLLNFVTEQLTKYDIEPKYIQFEITESTKLNMEEDIIQRLTELQELGIKIAIDDFGTGYASLTYLRDFPADIIKIDQKFIQSMHYENKKDSAIISSIIHLANGLDIKVIAEGVEEYEQLEFLKQNECNEIQGYLFSKPVPVDKFTQMLHTGYLKPTKPLPHKAFDKERRKHFRLQFPFPIIGETSIIEVQERSVNLGKAEILIENISLGGLKMISMLNLPVNATMKFRFYINLMGETFELDGRLVWKNESKRNTFHYGVAFNMNESERDRLAEVINKITILQKLNHEIPDTPFINENPIAYLQKNRL